MQRGLRRASRHSPVRASPCSVKPRFRCCPSVPSATHGRPAFRRAAASVDERPQVDALNQVLSAACPFGNCEQPARCRRDHRRREAAATGMSRTPTREALPSEGPVGLRLRRGSRILPATPSDMREICPRSARFSCPSRLRPSNCVLAARRPETAMLNPLACTCRGMRKARRARIQIAGTGPTKRFTTGCCNSLETGTRVRERIQRGYLIAMRLNAPEQVRTSINVRNGPWTCFCRQPPSGR